MQTRLLLVLVLTVASTSCGSVERAQPQRQRGKRELFADASLVPTREGERARRELALAEELERLLARSEVAASVTVSLVEPASAVVVAQTGEPASVEAIARAALPSIAEERVHVVIAELGSMPMPANPSKPGLRGLALALSVALGLSLGVALERAWQRRR